MATTKNLSNFLSTIHTTMRLSIIIKKQQNLRKKKERK